MSTDQIPQASRPTNPRVALLIDGENVSAAYAGRLITQASGFGCLTVKCVFGDIGKIGKWGEAPGFRLIHTGTGKNATDVRLVIEALDLLHLGRFDALALAASDGDYTHLAQYLVERGFPMIGLGQSKTPESFRKSCTRFVELKSISSKSVSGQERENNRSDTKIPQTLDEQIATVLSEAGGSLEISQLNARMRSAHSVKISEMPEKTWRAYLVARSELYRCDERGPQAQVHLAKSTT